MEIVKFSRCIISPFVGRVVNLWLYLVDDELRLDELRGSGYDLYIKDAGRLADIVGIAIIQGFQKKTPVS